MEASEAVYLLITPVLMVLLALWVRRRSTQGTVIMWPIAILMLLVALVVAFRVADRQDVAGMVLMVLLPATVSLLPLSIPAVRQRKWLLANSVVAAYLVGMLVAVNIGLYLDLLKL